MTCLLGAASLALCRTYISASFACEGIGPVLEGITVACKPTAATGASHTGLLAVEPAAAQTEAAVPEPLPEPYTSLFKQAKEAPTEFNTWTSLITAAEKLVRVGLTVLLSSTMAHQRTCCCLGRCRAQAVGCNLLYVARLTFLRKHHRCLRSPIRL